MIDTITEFKGIAVGRVEYLSGCNQILVQQPCKPDGDFVESRWFDEEHMNETDRVRVQLNVTSPGFDKPAPRR